MAISNALAICDEKVNRKRKIKNLNEPKYGLFKVLCKIISV